MTPSTDCVDMVKGFEGLELAAYPDPGTGGAPWTIGYGTTGSDIHPGLVWTQAQCEARLAADLARFSARVAALIGAAPTSQSQFDGLVSIAYNIGSANLSASTLLKRHKAGEYDAAAEEFPKWIRSAGRVLPGLIRRRAAEAALYLKDTHGPADTAPSALAKIGMSWV